MVERAIETILTNEKYVGDVIFYKTFSPDFPEKKRIPNSGEHKKYLQEDHHPAIISREQFQAVQEARESRSNIEAMLMELCPESSIGTLEAIMDDAFNRCETYLEDYCTLEE